MSRRKPSGRASLPPANLDPAAPRRRRRRWPIVLLALVVLVAVTRAYPGGNGSSSSTTTTTHTSTTPATYHAGYTASFQAGYVHGCEKAAPAAHATAAYAASFCRCTLHYFEGHVALASFRTEVAAIARGDTNYPGWWNAANATCS